MATVQQTSVTTGRARCQDGSRGEVLFYDPSGPQRSGRGWYTAIGVSSILFALLGAGYNLWLGYMGNEDRQMVIASSTVPWRHAAVSGGLTSAETGTVLQQAEGLFQLAQPGSKALTPQQAATLRRLLSTPGQQLVPPGPFPTGVKNCVPFDSVGGRRFDFHNSSTLLLDAQGGIVAQSTPAPFVPFTINPGSFAALIAAAAVSLGLAVLLLVAGVLALRHRRCARRLHLVYAWLKIPAALAVALCLAHVTSRFSSDLAAGAGVPFDIRYPSGISWRDALDQAARPALFGCIYPLALLIALNSKVVRSRLDAAESVGDDVKA
jgi:hypothetical protein